MTITAEPTLPAGRDFADEQGSLPCAWSITEDMVAPQVPALAVERVNFVGEAGR